MNRLREDADNLQLLHWSDDVEQSFKQINKHVEAQKMLITTDIQEIKASIISQLDTNLNALLSKVDENHMAYRSKFVQFSNSINNQFRSISKKLKYLGDTSVLSAKLNVLDIQGQTILLKDVQEAISSDTIPLNEVNIIELFTMMNKTINSPPTYTPLDPEIRDSHVKSLIQTLFNVQSQSLQSEANVNLKFGSLDPKNAAPPSAQAAGPLFSFVAEASQQHQSVAAVAQAKASFLALSVQNSRFSSDNPHHQSNKSLQQPEKRKIFQDVNKNTGLKDLSPQSARYLVLQNTSPNRIQTGNNQIISNQNQNSNERSVQHIRNGDGQRISNGGSSTNLPFNSAQFSPIVIAQESSINPYLTLKATRTIPFDLNNKYMAYLGSNCIGMTYKQNGWNVVGIFNTSSSEYSSCMVSDLIQVGQLVALSGSKIANEIIIAVAASTMTSPVIAIFSFNKETKVMKKCKQLEGFSNPVVRIVDLFEITNDQLLAASDEKGEVSVYNYQTTQGYGLNRVHNDEVICFLPIPLRQNGSGQSTGNGFLQGDLPRFVSLDSNNILAVYTMQGKQFVLTNKLNLQIIGGAGVKQLKMHPQHSTFLALGKDEKLYRVDLTSDMKLQQVEVIQASDFATFSASEEHNQGLVVTSNKNTSFIRIYKSEMQERTFDSKKWIDVFISQAMRKVLYVDNKLKILFVINFVASEVKIFSVNC